MPTESYRDEEGPEVYDDVEEYVDADEHEAALASERRRLAREARERAGREEYIDEDHYGEETGEAFEKPDDA